MVWSFWPRLKIFPEYPGHKKEAFFGYPKNVDSMVVDANLLYYSVEIEVLPSYITIYYYYLLVVILAILNTGGIAFLYFTILLVVPYP